MNTQPTYAERFFQAWIKVTTAWHDQLVESWQDYAGYTNLIINDYSVISEVATQLNLLCYPHEYYALDAVLYEQHQIVPRTDQHTCWLREISVAFENENYFNHELYQEVAHLMLTQCDLRVLVTYSWAQVDQGKVTGDNHILNYLHEIIDGCRLASSIDVNQSFLLILGEQFNGKISWQGLVYRKSGWYLFS